MASRLVPWASGNAPVTAVCTLGWRRGQWVEEMKRNLTRECDLSSEAEGGAIGVRKLREGSGKPVDQGAEVSQESEVWPWRSTRLATQHVTCADTRGPK